MTLREKAQQTIAEAEEAFLDFMRTELAVAHTRCVLAEQEHGKKRAHHIQQAEKAFEMTLELASRVPTHQQDRDAIEEARHNIHRLGGRDFSQPHD